MCHSHRTPFTIPLHYKAPHISTTTFTCGFLCSFSTCVHACGVDACAFSQMCLQICTQLCAQVYGGHVKSVCRLRSDIKVCILPVLSTSLTVWCSREKFCGLRTWLLIPSRYTLLVITWHSKFQCPHHTLGLGEPCSLCFTFEELVNSLRMMDWTKIY